MRKNIISAAAATPDAIDRRAAIAEARMVLGVIDVLENLDTCGGSLEEQLSCLTGLLDQPVGNPAQPPAGSGLPRF